MKGFKVHEDSAFEPYAPTLHSKGVKDLKNVISGPENAHVPSKKQGKAGGKQQLKPLRETSTSTREPFA